VQVKKMPLHDNPKLVTRAEKFRSRGMSFRSIAERIGVSASTVRVMLTPRLIESERARYRTYDATRAPRYRLDSNWRELKIKYNRRKKAEARK
jgi:orotate phosphoribosyltransferase-like protein